MSNQRLLFLVALLTLVLEAWSSPLQERSTSKCTTRDIAIVRRTVSDEIYFCKWWLSDIRTRSPFLEFTPSQVTGLCKCIASSNTASKPKREEGSVEAMLEKRQSQASCTAEMSKQFTEPWHFCNFYNAYPRTSSPFALYSAKQLLTLCKCVVTKQVSSVPFCSSQSALLASKPTLLSQASQYCSSLLRPTVSAVKTITKGVTMTKTQTRGTSIVSLSSTIRRTSTVDKISTEKVVQPVTVKSTATETSKVIEYVDTTNLGTVSFATETEMVSQTVRIVASTEVDAQTYVTVIYRRDVSAFPAAPSVWKSLAPAQATQVCNCFIKSESLKPTTVYVSTRTMLTAATSFTTKQAQDTRVVSVTLISTVDKVSTVRSTFTSVVSTVEEEQTIISTTRATLTTSVNALSTSIDRVSTTVTYTCPGAASVTPTATIWETSLSTVTATATITIGTYAQYNTTRYLTTETATSYITAPPCTRSLYIIYKRQATDFLVPSVVIRPAELSKYVVSSTRIIDSTVSICPPISTLTSTITSTTSSFTTSTTTETVLMTTTTSTKPYALLDTTTTITAFVTPPCSTTTIFL